MSKNKNKHSNIIYNEFKAKTEEEEESLKELYEELDLKNLMLISIDTRNENFRKTQPNCLYDLYGGKLDQLPGLNKKITFLELCEKICVFLKWPYNELRLWDHSTYKLFIQNEYDVYSEGKYRDYIPKPLELDQNEIMFPLFLSDQYIIAERINSNDLKFPSSPKPLSFNFESWTKYISKDWNKKIPNTNYTIYNDIEIVRMERNKRKNSLFNSIGYLLHIMANVKGQEELDENVEGITQPSRYRAGFIRKSLAFFVADWAEEIEKSGLFAEFGSINEYIKRVTDYNHSGDDLDLTLLAIKNGILIQIFSVKSKQLTQYGNEFVYRYGNPKRLGPKFAIKLVKWADGNYDPITFSMQPGLEPDRFEEPFCTAYVINAFKWIKEINEDQTEALNACSNCEIKEKRINTHLTCSYCRLVYYCSKKCQILNWRNYHKGVCQKRDFIKESNKCEREEKNSYCSILSELDDRLNGKIGISKLQKMDFSIIENENGSQK